jgi:hypothetical protein
MNWDDEWLRAKACLSRDDSISEVISTPKE